MNRRMRKLLQYLRARNGWDAGILIPLSVGPKTMNLAIECGYVRTRKVDRKRVKTPDGMVETYGLEIRITPLGKKMLKESGL